jgi:hypothetical protein
MPGAPGNKAVRQNRRGIQGHPLTMINRYQHNNGIYLTGSSLAYDA